MKMFIAAAALAATTATVMLPSAASAFDVRIGPRGGVGIGLGHPGYGYGYGGGYRRPLVGPRVYEGRSAFRPGIRRDGLRHDGFRRF